MFLYIFGYHPQVEGEGAWMTKYSILPLWLTIHFYELLLARCQYLHRSNIVWVGHPMIQHFSISVRAERCNVYLCSPIYRNLSFLLSRVQSFWSSCKQFRLSDFLLTSFTSLPLIKIHRNFLFLSSNTIFLKYLWKDDTKRLKYRISSTLKMHNFS